MSNILRSFSSVKKYIKPNKFVELKFPITYPGSLEVYARANYAGRNNPTKRRVEIVKPSQSASAQTEEGTNPTTIVTYNVTTQDITRGSEWTCRVTNLENSTQEFELNATYPGDIFTEKFEVPSHVISQISPVVKQIAVKIDSGNNNSFIRFPQIFGIPHHNFTVTDFTYRILGIKIREYINDLNSNDVNIGFGLPKAGMPNGWLQLIVSFEETGKEVLGDWHGDMKNIRLVIDLPLEVNGGKISYIESNIIAYFEFDLNMYGISDTFLDPIIGYSNTIRSLAGSAARSVFTSSSMQRAFSEFLTNATRTALRASHPNAEITAVSVEKGNLVIWFIP